MIVSENENPVGHENAQRAARLLNDHDCVLPEGSMRFLAATDSNNGDSNGATVTLNPDKDGPDF